MNKFEFSAPSRIIFGTGTIGDIGLLAREMGSRVLLVTGQSGADPGIVVNSLRKNDLSYHMFTLSCEPDIELIRLGTNIGIEQNADLVIGFGGGSAMDAGKAIAAMISNRGDILDYLEVVGKGMQIQKPSLPYIAVPTTAGTGSEVTKNAVITDPGRGFKASLRSALIQPRIALVDPKLTISLPPRVTAETGMDALTQVLEPYVSMRSNPMTDIFCIEGLRSAVSFLKSAYIDGSNLEARNAMSWTSLMSGLALANAGLGTIHGFASPIGGKFAVPHGAICARLLPFVVKGNIKALRERIPDSPVLGRYQQIAQIFFGKQSALPEDGFDWLMELCEALEIQPLSAYGIGKNDIDLLVESAMGSSSMKSNPIALTREELATILALSL
jgi:alcohol dehydrogenase class IV